MVLSSLGLYLDVSQGVIPEDIINNHQISVQTVLSTGPATGLLLHCWVEMYIQLKQKGQHRSNYVTEIVKYGLLQCPSEIKYLFCVCIRVALHSVQVILYLLLAFCDTDGSQVTAV